MTTMLEHANLTVPNPKATAAMLCDLFGWHTRWQGSAMDDGYTVHVGNDSSYLALYAPGRTPTSGPSSYVTVGGLNHLGVSVEDLDATEARVIAAGFTPNNHADYEPGRRFYFDDLDGIEYEVAQYD